MTVQSVVNPMEVNSAVSHPATIHQMINSSSVGTLLLPANGVAIPPRRLVVLIPDQDVNEADLARHLWTWAETAELDILLLGSITQGDEAYVRRRLTNIASFLRNGRIRVETTLRHQNRWEPALQESSRPGDLLVCHAEQRISYNGLKKYPLSEVLLTTFNKPVYVLKGFYPGLRVELSLPIGRWISAVVPIIIIIGFFFLQIRIDIDKTGWIGKILFMLSILIEAVLIGLWEHAL